jgi:PilZ domain
MSVCSANDIIHQAVAKQRTGQINIRLNNSRYKLGIRFVGESDLVGVPGVWAQIISGDRFLVDKLIASNVNLEVCFNVDNARVFFDTVMLQKKSYYLLNKTVLLTRPENATVIEQRHASREWVPDEMEIAVTLTRPAVDIEQPMEISGRLWDISEGGASAIVPPHNMIQLIQPLELLKMCLSWDDVRIRIDAVHRYTQPLSASSIRIGCEFSPLEESPEGQTRADLRRLLDHLKQQGIERHFRQTLRSR